LTLRRVRQRNPGSRRSGKKREEEKKNEKAEKRTGGHGAKKVYWGDDSNVRDS